MESIEFEGAAPSDQSRMWAMWCHLGALAGSIVQPFGNIIVPGIIWLAKRRDDPYVDLHGRESLNFQITVTIYAAIALALTYVLVGYLLIPALVLAAVVLVIIAGLQANEGAVFRYPFTLRLLKTNRAVE